MRVKFMLIYTKKKKKKIFVGYSEKDTYIL